MQVKKYEASSVIEALKQVKADLGPDAIVLSTKEGKRSVTGQRNFTVVAAVSENQLKKKELAVQQLGDVFQNKVSDQSAIKQKMFIDNVYRGIEKKHEARNRSITQTRYIEIDDELAAAKAIETSQHKVASEPVPQSNVARVKAAAQEAFKSSLNSEFFKQESEQEALLPEHILQAVTKADKKPSTAIENMIFRLKHCGVSKEILAAVENQATRELSGKAERRALVDSWFAKWILNRIQVTSGACQESVEVFVGPHGAGKTSALIRQATHYVAQENKSVAIVTTDLNKVGAVEQLRVYSRILNVPVFVAPDLEQMQAKLTALSGFDKVLVDTPGISLSNMDELDFMRGIAQMQVVKSHRVHLVVSALTKESDLGGLLKRFRVVDFKDIIVSNIDQTTQHGILINIQEKAKLPFHAFGIGSDVVDGFEYASRERVLDLVFKLTKQSGDRGNDSRI